MSKNDFDAALIAVIGAGTMGSSIALMCAQKGFTAINVDISEKQLETAKQKNTEILQKLTEKGKLTYAAVQDISKRIKYTRKYSDIKDPEIVIEALPEDIALKIKVIGEIEKLTPKETIILSNTSSLDINEIAKNISRPQNIMAAHFFNPPTVMKLVELVKGEKTSPEVLKKVSVFMDVLGKDVVIAPASPGFIVNRILIPVINEAAFLLSEGTSAEDVDKAMQAGAGHPMGPLRLGDLIGLDIVLEIMNTLGNSFGRAEKYEVCPLIEQMVEEGRLGVKTGMGFYRYETEV